MRVRLFQCFAYIFQVDLICEEVETELIVVVLDVFNSRSARVDGAEQAAEHQIGVDDEDAKSAIEPLTVASAAA